MTQSKFQPSPPDKPKCTESLYRQSETWDSTRFEHSLPQRQRVKVISAMLHLEIQSILDVGCGNGFITRELRAPRVVGLDPSAEALSHFQGEKVLGVAQALPFDKREFDAIVCSEVLEHLPEQTRRRACLELMRVAKRFILVGVPYREDLLDGMTVCASCGKTYHVHRHCGSFRSPKHLLRLLTGFRIECCTYLGFRRHVRLRLFRRLTHVLTGPSATSSMALCPACGCKNTATATETGRRKRRRQIVESLAKRMATTWHPRWMIVLLRRQVRR